MDTQIGHCDMVARSGMTGQWSKAVHALRQLRKL